MLLFFSFLLDRLLQYERVDEESSGRSLNKMTSRKLPGILCVLRVFLFSDSDATVSSDSDGEGARERDRDAGKK